MTHYDFILSGGGLAGLSLAYSLINSPLRDRSIRIVDPDAKELNDRTWSYWSDRPTLFDDLACRTWDRLHLAGLYGELLVNLRHYRYRTIRGCDFYDTTQRKEDDFMNPAKTQSNSRQMPIILLTLATAMIHLVLLNIMLVNAGMGISIPFILNGLGYLALLAAYTLPLPWVKEQRNLVRWAFIGFTAVTILLWVVMGYRNFVGYADKLIEVALIALLFLDRK